jgi:hypothetical protein
MIIGRMDLTIASREHRFRRCFLNISSTKWR